LQLLEFRWNTAAKQSARCCCV